MASNENLKAEASRLRRQATKKVSRIKANTGALISGTSVDPRNTSTPIAKMNAKELASYTSGLQSFLSRKEQFVAGSRGVPIHREKWMEYKKAEAAANKNVSALYEAIKDVKLPSGMTIAQNEAMGRAAHPQMTDPSVNSPRPVDRSPRRLDGEHAIDKMIEGQNKRADKEWLPEQIAAGRVQWNMMMDRIDLVRKDADVPATQRDRVDALTDEQFGALLYTEFMNDASLNYQSYVKLAGNTEKAFLISKAEEAMQDYDRLITWAEKLKIFKPQSQEA